MTFEGNQFKYKEEDESLVVYFTVDVSKSPKHINISATIGDEVMTLKGIYKLDGDTIILCITRGGGDRPTNLESQPNTEQAAVVLKRQTK